MEPEVPRSPNPPDPSRLRSPAGFRTRPSFSVVPLCASMETPPPLSREEAQALLDSARSRIIEVDDLIIRTIGERRELVLSVARAKQVLGLPVMDPAREAAVVRQAAVRARDLGVDEEMTRDVIWRIMASARADQEGRGPESMNLPGDVR
jgi:chorismate mutase